MVQRLIRKYYIYLGLFLLITFSAFLRLYHMPDRAFLVNDVWLWTIGINLHKTPLFNFGAHTTENFFKSLIATPYGWADTLPSYIASGIYNTLGIPLNEFWLYFMHAFLALLSIALIFYLGKLVFASRRVGFLAASFLAILPINITVFGSGLAYHHDFLIFLQLMLAISVMKYLKTRSLLNSVFLSASLFLNAGTENLIILPLMAILYYLSKKKFGIRDILIWLPSIIVIALLYYVAIAFKENNVGILRYVDTKFVGNIALTDMVFLIKRQAKLVYDNFFGWFFIATCILSIMYFIKNKAESDVKFLWLWAWFIFMFLMNVLLRQGDHIMTFRYSHMFVPLILISAFLINFILNVKRSLNILMSILLTAFFVNAGVTETGKVLARKVYSNPIKAASFYVREHGGKEATVFQLVSSDAEQNFWGEYYFGKAYIEPPEWTGSKRQLFSFGEHDIDEYLKAYGLKDFDFYIDYYTGSDQATGIKKEQFLNSIARRGIKKVADIKRGDRIVATVYSSHPLQYEVMDAALVDKIWDKSYANIKSLLQNNWCGLAVLRGYHHRLD